MRKSKPPESSLNDLVTDKKTLEKSEAEVALVKDEMELWADRGYILIRSFGSADGFSRDYMFDLKKATDHLNLRLEVVEVNRGLVAMETGNFIGFNVMAHVDDERAVRKFLANWFK